MSYIRVHFAKTQVQLRLDQKSSIPRAHGIIPPLAFSEGRRGRGKAGGLGDGEVCRRGGCKVNEANDNRIYLLSNRALGGYCLQYLYCHEGLCRMFGCTLRRHKCNCAWIRNLVSPVHTVQTPPSILRRSERFVEGGDCNCPWIKQAEGLGGFTKTQIQLPQDQ